MKQIISNPQAPKAIGAYSQAVKTGTTVYLSGQIPLIPETMELIAGDIKQQIHQIFKNIKAVIEAAGGNLLQIVKLTVYLIDLNNYAALNEVMKELFDGAFPARSVIGVNELPKGAQIEIDAIVVLGDLK